MKSKTGSFLDLTLGLISIHTACFNLSVSFEDLHPKGWSRTEPVLLCK